MKTKYRNTSRRRTPWDNKENLEPMEAFIKSKYLDSFNHKHPKIDDTDESKLLNNFKVEKCRYCDSKRIKKKGFTSNHLQRYQCADCNKTFTILTNTIFDNHKISITEWIEYCLDLFRYISINTTAKTNKNSATTSKYWLSKLFIILDHIQDNIVLEGDVQIDETFFPIAEKDKTVKNGKGLRGLSSNQICIGIGFDGHKTYARFEGFGKTSQRKTLAAFENHIKEGSHLIHDKEKSHTILVNKLKLESTSYDANELKKLKDKDNPLQKINHQCYLLKRFLKAHSGFDRTEIQSYINLFCFMQNPPNDHLEKVKILLISAIHLTKSLRFRDLYKKKH